MNYAEFMMNHGWGHELRCGCDDLRWVVCCDELRWGCDELRWVVCCDELRWVVMTYAVVVVSEL